MIGIAVYSVVTNSAAVVVSWYVAVICMLALIVQTLLHSYKALRQFLAAWAQANRKYF